MVTLNHINSQAVVPDQLLAYVKSVSGVESMVVGECLFHSIADTGVLVGYPFSDPNSAELLNESLEKVLKLSDIKHITVLSPSIPSNVPEKAQITSDAYWMIELPQKKISSKLSNMLRRAQKEVVIECGKWNSSHAALVKEFGIRKNLDPATLHILKNLESYLFSSTHTILFSAFKNCGDLAGFAIGDYSSFSTAFYMFAIRSPDAPPGTADLLLSKIIGEAEKKGYSRLNLGLGINNGIEFFKKKWNACKWLPFYEISWKIDRKGWFSRLFCKRK